MNTPLADLPQLLASMAPALHPGVFVFAWLDAGAAIDQASVVASIREPEGWSVVLAEADALEQRLPVLGRWAWITLGVPSDLQAVGFTAAFAAALARAGIACNVIAGARHDHVFVPHHQAAQALSTLNSLAGNAAG